MFIKVLESIAPFKDQLPCMNFDRSVVSLTLNMVTWVMLTKLTGCRTSTNQTCEIQAKAIFSHQAEGYNFNKLGRGSQDDATRHNIKAQGILVFFSF